VASYGFSDRRPKGSVAAVDREGRGALEASLFREVRDVGDERVIAPLLNSFASQEFGVDYGDYYLADGARLTYRHGSGVRGEWSAALGRETKSEEHTSELQSRFDLVCRLLLEK